MKIRNGFVSNSSSSSFVLITTNKTLKKILSKYNEKEKEYIGSMIGREQNIEILGNKLVVFSGEISSEGQYDIYCDIFGRNDDGDDDGDDCEKCSELLQKFGNEFKDKDDSFTDL